MVVSIDWGTKVISIPQADLTFVGGTLYQLDTDQLRKDVIALLASAEGMPFLDAINHNTEVTISGVTYARLIEFINGYTVTFEDGQYRVRFVGSNNNISDVANLNQVSLLPQNSAGLVNNASPSDIATAVLDGIVEGALTLRQVQRLLMSFGFGKTRDFQSNTPKFRDLADTKDRISAVQDTDGNRTSVTVDPN